jgi:hypothetical protein
MGVILRGGAQPAGAEGNSPICAPAVTAPLAAGATVDGGGAAGAAGLVVLPLEQAAPSSEKAANRADATFNRLRCICSLSSRRVVPRAHRWPEHTSL